MRRGLLALAAALALAGCGQEKLSPEAERGRTVYNSQCTACHNFDPSQPGAVGPEVKGASRELLEAKVVRGTYPPGYKPKRPTSVMPPQAQVAPDIPALSAYLK
ncbi:MAG TPA: cytochrome c [Methylomirabilota bacterium]|nr:cytochrome c [Methylomirabilota bacterium]